MGLIFEELVGGPAFLSPTYRAPLPNGVPLLVRPKRDPPLVAVETWLAAGAAREISVPGGTSHFLEHMIFKGTPDLPPGTVDRRVKEMGGYTNAGTSVEYTHYYVVALASRWRDALRLLWDVVTGPALPQEEVERERQVIGEEIARKEDDPEGKLGLLFLAALFPDHPYGAPILGTTESLAGINRTVLETYHRVWYRPPHLVLSVSGAVEPHEVLEAALELAVIEPGAPPEILPLPGPPLSAVQTAHRPVEQAYVASGYRTPGREDLALSYALEVLAAVLGRGRASRLHQRLVEDESLAVSVSAWTWALADAGCLGIRALLPPDRVQAAREVLEEEINRILLEGLGEEELQRARTLLAADLAYGNEEAASQGAMLAEYELLLGDAGEALRYLDRLEAVTAEALHDIAERVLRPEGQAMAVVLPNGGGGRED